MKYITTTALLLVAANLALAQTTPELPSFMALDENTDGRISKEEAQVDPRVAERFQEADANQDGYLSVEEFSALRR